MANNNFKFDIGQTVREVGELNKSLEALGQIAQGLFSNLGRLSETFGSKVTNAAQAVSQSTSVGPADMLTRAGTSNAAQALSNVLKFPQLNNTNATTSANEALQTAAANAQASAQQAQKAQLPQMPIQSNIGQMRMGGYSLADLPRMIGASSSMGGLNENIAKTIENLSKSGVESSRMVSGVLDKLRSDMQESNRHFMAALENFTAASKLDPKSQEYQNTQRDLIAAMKALEGATEDAANASRDAASLGGGGAGGGGGGGRFGKFMERMGGPGGLAKMGLNVAGGAAALGLGAYNLYNSWELGYRKAAFGAELDLANARGDIGAKLTQQALGQYDMTSAENLMRYRADIVFPGAKFNYIGTRGYGTSIDAAAKMVQENRELQRLERQKQLVNTGVTGIEEIVGGAAAGAVAGSIIPGLGTAVGALAGGGLAALHAGIRGIDQYFASPYTQYEGGAGRTRQLAARAQDQNAILDYAENFREADLRKHTLETGTINDILQSKASMRAGALLVGQYAVGPNDYADMRYKQSALARSISGINLNTPADFDASVARRVRYAETAGGRASGGAGGDYNAVNSKTGAYGAYQVIGKYWGIDPTKMSPQQQDAFFQNTLLPSYKMSAVAAMTKYPQAASMYGSEVLTGMMQLGAGNINHWLSTREDRTGGQIPGYIKSLQSQSKQAMVTASQQASESAGLLSINGADVAKTNMPWTQFGISQADYIYKRNQLTNVLGGPRVATDAQTQRILQYQYGGLGSFENMLGTLGTFNQAGGGGDSTRRLESVLTTAVSQGFDKSRTAGMFVQTTGEIARNLNLTNVGAAARSLGAQSLLAGRIGATVADERSLMQATTGINDYAAFTRQSGGVIGALKLQSAYGAGAGVGSGANMLQGRSVEEVSNMMTELNSNGKGTRNEALQDLLRLNGGDVNKVRSILQSQVTGGAQVAFRGMFNLIGAQRGTSFEKMTGDLSKATGKARLDIIGEMRALSRETAGTLGISEEGAIRGLGLELENRGLISARENKGQFEDALKRGQAKSIDPAEIMKRKVMDNLVTQYVSDPARKVQFAQYEEYVNKQGAPISVAEGMEGAGQAMTPEFLEKAKRNPALMRSVNKTLEKTNLTQLDLAQGMMVDAVNQSTDQKVVVTNFSMLAQEMVRMGLIKTGKNIQ